MHISKHLILLFIFFSPAINTISLASVPRAHFIDVGQADATLLEFPCAAILIDAGGDTKKLLSYIETFFERRKDLNNTLSLLVATHAHLDHTKNINIILQNYKVMTLLTNGNLRKKGYKSVRSEISKQPHLIHKIGRTVDIHSGGLFDHEIDRIDCDGEIGGNYPDIRLMWGQISKQNWSKKAYQEENNHSVAIMVHWGQSKSLFTGDMEAAALRRMMKLHGPSLKNIDLYKISHHGFKNGTTKGFLEHLSPKVAVLSRSSEKPWYKENLQRFNHTLRQKRPEKQVPVWATNAKRKRGIFEIGTLTSATYWTGIDGTVIARLDQPKNEKVDVELK